jgi:prepilin-type N-terminal cleavage/methylation domain-containing protein
VRRPSGFTMLEIVVVLLLMSIVGATLIGRSITTSNLDLNSAADKLSNHLRYAQAEAMKLAYKDYPVWGINFTNGGYWMFRGTNPNTKVRFPGVDSDDVNLSTEGISIPTAPQTVLFDRIGKPYSAYTTEANNTPLPGTMTVRLSSGAQPREIKITPETGLVR